MNSTTLHHSPSLRPTVNTIVGLAAPEVLSIMVHMVYLIDMSLIAKTQEPGVYLSIGLVYTLIHLIVKMSEGLGVASLILCARGIAHQDASALARGFTVAAIGGGVIAALTLGGVWMATEVILTWYKLPACLFYAAVPYVRLRAVGLALLWMSMPMLGLLRAFGLTRVIMRIALVAAALFLIIDITSLYGLGPCGPWGIHGSACASIVQQLVMCAGSAWVIGRRKLMSLTECGRVIRQGTLPWTQLGSLGLPIVADKATLAAAKVWLAGMIGSLGPLAQGTFCMVKDLEQAAFIPALAMASACTILVSRFWAAGDMPSVRSAIARCCGIGVAAVSSILILFMLWPRIFIRIFDVHGTCGDYAASVLAWVSVLVLCDVLQLILAASVRATGHVALVMIVRIGAIGGLMIPLASLCAYTFPPGPFALVAVFGSFYIAGCGMSLAYLWWLQKALRQKNIS